MVKRWRLQPCKEVEQRAALRAALITLSALLRVVDETRDREPASSASHPTQQPNACDGVDSVVRVVNCRKESLGVTGPGVGQEEKPPPARSHPEGLL